MMSTNGILRHCLYLLLLSLVSCAYNKVPKEIGPEIACASPDTISFSKQVLPILVNNCAITSCHSGRTPEGNFNLEASVAYATLSKSGSGYIDTLNPRFSVLYSSMVSVSQPMPPSGKLDKCTLAIIEKWMAQKAKNN